MEPRAEAAKVAKTEMEILGDLCGRAVRRLNWIARYHASPASLPPMSELKRTPLRDFHAAHGARLVDFAGWEMPVQYRSILEEHKAVRRAAGLFDVSHMGEVDVRGPEAAKFLK